MASFRGSFVIGARNVHLHAFYACAAMESKLNNYGLACLLLVGQYADLQKSERVYWEPKIRAGLTRIVDKIETPWRKLLALLLVGNEKQQDKAIDEFKNAILITKKETLVTHQVDLRDTIHAIRALAENNLSAHAQAFIATIHLSHWPHIRFATGGNNLNKHLCFCQKS